MRMGMAEETQRAYTILQEAQERGARWMSDIHIETNRQGQPILRIHAPMVRSAEINALLAQSGFFAAELHPFEGSLEEVFLELTTPPTHVGAHPGMVALAGRPGQNSDIPGGKRDTL